MAEEYLRQLRDLRRVRDPPQIHTRQQESDENTVGAPAYERSEDFVDISAYESSEDIDQEIESSYGRREDEHAQEIDPETLDLLQSLKEPEDSIPIRQLSLQDLCTYVRGEELDNENLDLSTPIPQNPRSEIHGHVRNQSSSGPAFFVESTSEQRGSITYPPTLNSSADIPVSMASRNVPKPGPANLRPNSTPEEWLKEAKLCHYLPEDIMKQLCEMVKEHLMEESNIQPVSTPVVVCGDIHGQFYDLLELFRVAGGMPGDTNVESPTTMITSDDLEPPTSIKNSSLHNKVGSQKDEGNEDEEESRGRPRTAGQSSRGGSSGADSGVKVNEVSGNGCQNFIFLGDFVDRGYFSLETLTLLLCLKALYPSKITLVRGNHESRQITQVYGFYEECIQKYGNASVWKACCQVFDFLILAAIIDGQILCVHGGLSPEIRTLDQIRVVARAQEIPHEGAFCDLVWSDPDDIETWGVSPRGAGWLFGEKVATEFNHVNGLKLIARAHQLVNEGYKYHFPSKNVVTVWSAPNYCYRCGNVASIMNVDSNVEEKFSIFAAVPEDKRHVPSGRRTVGEYFL